MYETSKLRANDELLYKEAQEILRSEVAEDERLRMKYGTDRWTRPQSEQAAENLYKRSAEIDAYLKSARNSDELLSTKLKEHESMLQLLSGSDRDIEDFVPSSRRIDMPYNIKAAAGSLRDVLSEISRLETSRKRTAERLREKGRLDDISKPLPLLTHDPRQASFPCSGLLSPKNI